MPHLFALLLGVALPHSSDAFDLRGETAFAVSQAKRLVRCFQLARDYHEACHHHPHIREGRTLDETFALITRLEDDLENHEEKMRKTGSFEGGNALVQAAFAWDSCLKKRRLFNEGNGRGLANDKCPALLYPAHNTTREVRESNRKHAHAWGVISTQWQFVIERARAIAQRVQQALRDQRLASSDGSSSSDDLGLTSGRPAGHDMGDHQINVKNQFSVLGEDENLGDDENSNTVNLGLDAATIRAFIERAEELLASPSLDAAPLSDEDDETALQSLVEEAGSLLFYIINSKLKRQMTRVVARIKKAQTQNGAVRADRAAGADVAGAPADSPSAGLGTNLIDLQQQLDALFAAERDSTRHASADETSFQLAHLAGYMAGIAPTVQGMKDIGNFLKERDGVVFENRYRRQVLPAKIKFRQRSKAGLSEDLLAVMKDARKNELAHVARCRHHEISGFLEGKRRRILGIAKEILSGGSMTEVGGLTTTELNPPTLEALDHPVLLAEDATRPDRIADHLASNPKVLPALLAEDAELRSNLKPTWIKEFGATSLESWTSLFQALERVALTGGNKTGSGKGVEVVAGSRAAEREEEDPMAIMRWRDAHLTTSGARSVPNLVDSHWPLRAEELHTPAGAGRARGRAGLPALHEEEERLRKIRHRAEFTLVHAIADTWVHHTQRLRMLDSVIKVAIDVVELARKQLRLSGGVERKSTGGSSCVDDEAGAGEADGAAAAGGRKGGGGGRRKGGRGKKNANS